MYDKRNQILTLLLNYRFTAVQNTCPPQRRPTRACHHQNEATVRRKKSGGRAEESSPPATDTNTWLVVTKGQMDIGGGEKLEKE